MLGNIFFCEHDFEKLADGSRLSLFGDYSPALFKCKKCKKVFKLVIGIWDYLKEIKIKELQD